jgi:DNA-binding NtrC family response regulator
MNESLLIVEDDTTLRLTVGEFLTDQGYAVDLAADGAAALELARHNSYRLILLDLRLPDTSGLQLLPQLRDLDNDVLIVTMTAYPEVRAAVAALKAGAYDYLNKPFDLDDLLELVRRALETRHLRHEVAWRRAQVDACAPAGLIGESRAFLEMTEMTRRIAAAGRVPVLIRGESGTGKEHVANSIHRLSTRAGGPWVTLNCSALPEGLLESELFGHERGAFTDARQAKRGLLELADGGVLFLDEIGDLALALQPKLLRVLETQSFRRLGGAKELRCDVRFVAATHRDLPAMVKAGRFREDLYYRLNVAAIDLPALRQRQADILPLARHFLRQAALAVDRPQLGLDPAVAPLLTAYAWPGNVRELRNVMERAAILCAGDRVQPIHLPREVSGAQPAPAEPALLRHGDGSPATLAEAELAHIRAVLDLCQGNKTRAAELLGITRMTLRSRLPQDTTAADTAQPGSADSDPAASF